MGGLHLLDPRGLLLLAGVAPLVVLYILRIRRRRQRVPSTWLWATAQRDLVARHPWRRLLPETTLLLELLALAALALALARPSSRGGSLDGDHVAIVIDASASMATRLGGPSGAETRMDAARRAARDAVAHLSSGADAMIVEAGREGLVVSPPERDVARLQAAIARVEAAEVEGDLPVAVALAADRLRSLGGRGRLVLVTDGALARAGPLVVAGLPVDVVTVGDAEDNAALVQVDVRPGVDAATRREDVQVFARIQSWASRPREAYVTLSLEGQGEPVASRRLRLGAEDKQPVVLSFEPRPEDHGRGLLVRLSPGDAAPFDDVAFGRVPASPRTPVVIASASSSSSWTSRAVEADPDVDLRRLTLAQLATVNVDPDALVIVEGACPAPLPGGDVLVLAPPAGDCLGVHVGAPVDDPGVTSWETGDPRLRFLTLDGVHVARARALEARGASAALVRAASATLIADASVPGRTATLVGFDVGDSDWPLQASFVLFVRNVVELARAHRLQGAAGPLRTGDAARVQVPAGTSKVTIDGPGALERERPVRDGVAALPVLDRAGLYHVRWSEPHVGSLRLAVNLTSAAESDVRPRPVTVEAAPGSTVQRPSRDAEGRQAWVPSLAALAALALALDVLWVTRPRRSRGATAP